MKNYIFTASIQHTPSKIILCLEDTKNKVGFYQEHASNILDDIAKLMDKFKKFTTKTQISSNISVINYSGIIEIERQYSNQEGVLHFVLKKAFTEDAMFEIWKHLIHQ